MAAWTGLLVLQASFVYYMSGVVDCGVLPITHSGVATPVCTRNCSSSGETSYTSSKCSCSESCSVFGDCCHDSPHKNAASWQRFDFVCASVAGVGRYRVVSSCPGDQLSDLCEANLGYLPPVTSGATGTTYGNYYCAWCNGDSGHLVTWEVDLNCLTTQETAKGNSSAGPSYIVYNRDEFYRINLQEETESLCQFHVRGGNASFLENLELRPCNATPMVSECPPSWKDISVVEECGSYENPVYHYNTLYKNPHCARCHSADHPVRCDPHSERSSRSLHLNSLTADEPAGGPAGPQGWLYPQKRDLSNRPEGLPYSFSHLFTADCSPPGCCPGARFDPRTNRCKKIRYR